MVLYSLMSGFLRLRSAGVSKGSSYFHIRRRYPNYWNRSNPCGFH